MDGWIMVEGGRESWGGGRRGWMGGSWGEPDLTNELIAGGPHSLTHINAISPHSYFQRKRVSAKYFWTLCATLGMMWQFDENIYCPSLRAI